MFRKPYRVKSNSQMKGTEKKKLKADLREAFPSMSTEALDSIIPSGKDDESQIRKVYTHSGENMLIYVFRKNPLFFVFEKNKKKIYPTVYTLWIVPDLLPSFTTHDNVMKNIQNGADLMLPGVVNPHDLDLKAIQKGDIVSINLTSCPGSVAIGYTALSGGDMVESGFRNKGVIILHSFGDHIWHSGTQDDFHLQEGLLESGLSSLDIKSDIDENSESVSKVNVEEETTPAIVDERSDVEKMDDLLKTSFLTALKTTCKNIELPVLTSNFFRVHMVEAAKPHELNIKKSSYKKLSFFLSTMSNDLKIITVSELQKGVESITSIDYRHEVLHFHKVERYVPIEEPKSNSEKTFVPPSIEELFLVSSAVLEFFKPHPKKHPFSKIQVREFLKDYISRENLGYGAAVKLDPILAAIVLEKNENNVLEMKWEELLQRILKKMSDGYCINGNKKLGKIPPIEMNTATRSGNKKVTLVYNLDCYGIDPHEVAHKCQVGVAASTTVDMKPANRKGGSEVLIQGNQIAYVTKLLTEVYGINKKYLCGTEKAIKPKKRK
ncbi:eukaryotic translation initiation factor 2D [Lepeophtheirus salmonis]|uniref:eukaryotic translation initiation factor 2D n=1 Tax=Lepeophtheirus salmonis TaxID=72036 RepID=UPI001AEA9B43|nr:eukaryotic translation initiation factor 2D-like [Lepeophtheirus salmonis]